jgi:hypothetical protein
MQVVKAGRIAACCSSGCFACEHARNDAWLTWEISMLTVEPVSMMNHRLPRCASVYRGTSICYACYMLIPGNDLCAIPMLISFQQIRFKSCNGIVKMCCSVG